MPVPTPRSGESQQKFVSRCIQSLKHTDPDRPDKQIQAICYSTWRRINKAEALEVLKSIKEDFVVIKGMITK